MLFAKTSPAIEATPHSSELTKDDNPLIWPLLSLLQESNHSWKVHHLAAELQQKGLMTDLDENSEKNLFKRNFLLMNALYELQSMLLPKQWLQVKAMEIVLLRIVPSDTNLLIAEDASLRDYYLDWNNYDTSANVVREILESFWNSYQDYIGANCQLLNKPQALKIFELDESASNKDVRRQWRKLALQHHPDRPNGDAEKFRQVCEAWQSLKAS